MSNQKSIKNNDHSLLTALFSRMVTTTMFLLKHILLAALIVAILTAVTAGYFFKKQMNTAAMTLIFNYDNATLGLAPNGVKHEISDVISTEVMQAALDMASITDMSPRDLAKCVTIVPPAGHGYSISDESTYFIATSYRITLTGSDQLNAHTITLRSMLSLIGKAYQEYFLNEYTERGIRIDIDMEAKPHEEYMETVSKFNQQAVQLQNYLKRKNNQSRDFVSTITGESFSSLRQQVQNLISVRIADCRAYIIEHGVSVNRNRYLSKIEYQNEDYSIRLRKRTNAYDIRMDAIDRYDGEMTSTVLIPTESSDRKFYMSKTKIGIDYIALDAAGDTTTASAIQKTIDQNNNIYSHMASSTYSSSVTKKAKGLVDDCREELVRLLNLTNETCKDESETKSKNYLLYYMDGNGLISSLGGKKLMAMACFYVFLVVMGADLLMRRREKNEKL